MINRIVFNNANKPIYVIADIHGNFGLLKNEIKNNELFANCIIICAGDIGVGFKEKGYYLDLFNELNNLLESKDIECLFIRGNHDDPSYFDNSINLSNLKLISDYSVITYNDYNILCIGGAISIDRVLRQQRYQSIIEYKKIISPLTDINYIISNTCKQYWEDEKPIFDINILNELKEHNIKINYLITHTSPSFAFKNDKDGIGYWLNLDKTLDFDTSNERSVMDSIYYTLKDNGNNIDTWVYGHFHSHNEGIHDNVKFVALKNFDSFSDIYRLI